MADAEAQYAPLAQQAGAMQRQLAEAQASAEAAAAEAARLSQELTHSRRASDLTTYFACGGQTGSAKTLMLFQV